MMMVMLVMVVVMVIMMVMVVMVMIILCSGDSRICEIHAADACLEMR